MDKTNNKKQFFIILLIISIPLLSLNVVNSYNLNEIKVFSFEQELEGWNITNQRTDPFGNKLPLSFNNQWSSLGEYSLNLITTTGIGGGVESISYTIPSNVNKVLFDFQTPADLGFGTGGVRVFVNNEEVLKLLYTTEQNLIYPESIIISEDTEILNNIVYVNEGDTIMFQSIQAPLGWGGIGRIDNIRFVYFQDRSNVFNDIFSFLFYVLSFSLLPIAVIFVIFNKIFK